MTGEIPWVRTPSSPTGRKIPLCSSCTRTEVPFVGVHREVTALSQLKMIPPAPSGVFPFSKIHTCSLRVGPDVQTEGFAPCVLKCSDAQMRRVSPWEKCLTKRDDSQSRIPVHVFLTLLHKNGSSGQVASASDCQVVRIEDIDVVDARARFTRRKVERHGSWHRIGRGNQRDRGSFKERPVEYQTAKLHLQPQSASQHSSRWPTRVESEAGTQSRPCCTRRLPGASSAFVGKGHCDFNGWGQLHVLIVSAFSY